MDNSHSISPFLIGITDFCLLNISFFAMNYWTQGTWEFSPAYIKLLMLFYFIWFFISFFTKKFRFASYRSYAAVISLYTRSAVYTACCASFVVVMMGLPAFSRLHVLVIWFMMAIQEVLIFSVYYMTIGESAILNDEKEDIGARQEANYSIFLLLTDFLIVGVSFFIINYLKTGSFGLRPQYNQLLLVIYALWLITSLTTNKFARRPFQNYYHSTWPWLKAGILMVGIMCVTIFAYRLFHFSRIHVFGSIFLLIFFELLLCRVYSLLTHNRIRQEDIESVENVKGLLKQKNLSLETDFEKLRLLLLEPVRKGLQEKYLRDYPRLFDLIDQSLDLSEIIQAEMTIINSNDMFHIKTIDGRPVRLLINLHRTNNIRWINRYFLEVHNVLVSGGYFVGRTHTIATHREWLFKKYPKHIANTISIIEFCLNRVLPKLPGLKQAYFAVTKGRDRVLSKAEVLGRLCFCGFRIIAVKEIEERLVFVAQKVKTPSLDQSPSYGPLVKFSRVGMSGGNIDVYKFRTMHPYSEYLQQYMYEKNNLQQGGKFKGDFRITGLGRFMRKTWLDELPMLYNWIRGELNLVGVRPLSYHYFDLYPSDLKELRNKVVPGLIPPFYMDMPKTFDEICESEKRYIQAYQKQPVKTQWVYFWKAFYNIVFNGERSN